MIELGEYLDEVNALAEQLETDGDVAALERLHTTVTSMVVQNDWDIEFDWDGDAEAIDKYLDTVPP